MMGCLALPFSGSMLSAHRSVVTLRLVVHRFAHPLSAYCIRVIYACAQTHSKFKFEKADVGTMLTHSIDLCWRVVWFDLVHASHEIADLFCLSERTIRRYITLFHQTGDVKPVSCRNGPQRLLGDLEHLHLFQLILHNPSIYLHELQHRLQEAYGVRVHVSTICRSWVVQGRLSDMLPYSNHRL